MQVFAKEGIVRFVPENEQEHQIITENFSEKHLKSSKFIKVKNFVNEFGEPSEKKYVEIKGFEEKNGKIS